MIKLRFFIGSLIFFVAILTFLFAIYLYIRLVVAVKNNKDVPKWMYKIGHDLTWDLRGISSDGCKDFTDKSVLTEVNFYIIGVVIANIAVYLIFFSRYYTNDVIVFWMRVEMFIIIAMKIILILGKVFVNFILSAVRKSKYKCEFSAAANAVIDMFLISIVACVLAFNITGFYMR